MPGSFDFTGQNINDTYKRVVQYDGEGNFYDGTGSLINGAFPGSSVDRLSQTYINPTFTGSITASGHILPSQDATYDLGSPDLFFRTASIEHIQTLDSTIEFFRKVSDGQGGFNRVKEGRIKIEDGALKVEDSLGQRAPLTASFGMFTDGVKVEGTSTFMHNLVVEDAGNNHVRIDTPLTASSVSASVYYGDGSNLTGITHTDISALNTFTGSIQTSVNTLTAATSSYNTSTANVTLDTSTLIMTDVSAEITSAESQSIDTTPTSSNAIFYNYVLENYQASGSNRSSRAGNLILINDGTNVNLSDYTVTALGDGDDPYFSASIEDTDTNLYLKDGQSYHFKAVKQHFVAPTSSVELPDTDGAAPLLDQYSGAIVAYSLRKLSSTYTGDAIRVRRNSDNAETDIGFTSAGDLDISAIATHCGSSVGYVTKWYDQSGNDRHATQSIADSQPKIYDGSSVYVLDNGVSGINYATKGRPAINMNNNSNTTVGVLLGPSGIDYRTGMSIYIAGHTYGSSDYVSVFNSSNQHQSGWRFGTGTSGAGFRIGSTNITATGGGRTDQYPQIMSGHYPINGSVGGQQFYQMNYIPWGTTYADLGQGSNTTVTMPDTTNNILRITGRTHENGRYQEIIIFDTSTTSNRADIFKNMNDYYGIYHDGLFRIASNATAAYSVRKLMSTYTGDAMDIRRASDNTEQTIGFTSAGDLDTGSIETFCTGTECYVDTWYDQSGNGNHATQTNANNQPLIYISGSVFTKNNIAAIDFSRGTPNEPHWNDDKKKNMQFTLSSTIAQPTTYTMVHDYKAGPGYGKIFGGTNQQMLKSVIMAGSYLSTPSPVNIYQVNSIIFSGSNSIRRVNNSQVSSGNPGSDSISGTVLIGGDANSANYWDSGSFQEFILWPSNQSSLGNISAIETNINDYFDIY